jgi:formylglycine-generating enzyme required for sulfatase activity
MSGKRFAGAITRATLILAFAAPAGARAVAASPAVPAPAVAPGRAVPGEMVRIPGGRYRPLYRQGVRGTGRDTLLRRVVPLEVAPFELDRRPVTNAQYLEFVRAHPEWRRSRVSRLFADESYLRHWRDDLDPGPAAAPASPVVNVSWFAARAWCAAYGKRLPTVAEWELAAAADETHRDASRDPAFLERLREWYARPSPAVLPPVGHGFHDVYGVDDLHGLVWEWTLDFNSALVSGESRAGASPDRSLYCGGGASTAADFADYAAFMRFAYRASLEARYTTAALGFRGARDVAAVRAGPGPSAGKRSTP